MADWAGAAFLGFIFRVKSIRPDKEYFRLICKLPIFDFDGSQEDSPKVPKY